MKTSNINKFYELSREDRIKALQEFADLNGEDIALLKNTGAIDFNIIDHMIENAVSVFPLPLGIATNFLINGKDKLIPMAIEETSVVAAASHAAKIAREKGGFRAVSGPQHMIGQIQLTNVLSPNNAKIKIYEHKEDLIKIAAEKDQLLKKLGGGPVDIDVRILDKNMLVVHIIVNTLDAMGANTVNTMAEAIAPVISDIAGGKINLKIISNLAVYRLVRAYATFSKDKLPRGGYSGEEVVDRIIDAYKFAYADPFRCATHNKGIMNGISAVVIATGNDFRAIEAGAHAYASYTGSYKPLTSYEKDGEGNLVGSIELPMAVGVVGGAVSVHPVAKLCKKILDVKTAAELQGVIASVGLAQNFAALYALTTEGIQKGHMRLHARNIAVSVGAIGDEIDIIAKRITSENNITMPRAKEILEELHKKRD